MRPEWEDAIREGRKNIDARPVADDIANVKVGSVIRYPGARVRVTHMRFYAGFNDLLAHEDWRRIGLTQPTRSSFGGCCWKRGMKPPCTTAAPSRSIRVHWR
jgi:ASC-1-like (ASCH) protein